MTTETLKKKKNKGPIRFEAIVPFVIVCVLAGAYFKLFFDSHLKSAIEIGGYHALGSEVNVASLSTSFFDAKVQIKGLELTNSQKPTHNSLKIGEIRFGLLWDALLRAKFVINEIAVEAIEVDTPRKQKGKVKPPPPPSEKKGPSLTEELKGKAIDKVGSENESNLLGNLASMMKGSSGQAEVQKIESALSSEKFLKELQADINSKETQWKERFKNLPQAEEFKSLSDRLKKVKTSGFKNPDEVKKSIEEIDKIFKEADSKVKTISAASSELSQDLKAVDSGVKNLEALIQKDIKELEARFKIPSLDANNISRSIFMQYLTPYIQKVDTYKGYADKYLPPKLTGKKKPKPDEIPVQPHPRASGVTYEFGQKNSYPMFWIKKVSISSQSAGNPNMGDLKGYITDISSNQKITRKPTVAELSGDFPGKSWSGLLTRLEINNVQEDSLIAGTLGLSSFPLSGRELLNTKDMGLSFSKAAGALAANINLKNLKDLNLKIQNSFSQVAYDIQSENTELKNALTEILADIPSVTLDVKAQGTLPKVPIEISSNLGGEIAKGLQKQVQKKIDEARKKIEAQVNERIAAEKAKIEAQIAQFKSQTESEIKKIQAQLESQKNQINSKKTEIEKSAKKGVEDQLKKALGKDGQKKVDDLKKKLGL